MFLKYFHLIYNCCASSCGKMFVKYVFIGWSVAGFILLAKFFYRTFNLFINNLVRDTIFDEGLYFVFNSLRRINLEKEINFARDIRLLIIAILYRKEHLFLKLRLQLLVVVFLKVEVVKLLVIVVVSIRKSRKRILLFSFSS